MIVADYIFILGGFVVGFLLFCGAVLLIIFPFLFTHESAMRVSTVTESNRLKYVSHQEKNGTDG